MGVNNKMVSLENDYKYLTKVFDMIDHKKIYTLEDVYLAVNNWSMSQIDKQTIEKFLTKK
jgi:hypothetical protein